jgi:hypothetical protein
MAILPFSALHGGEMTKKTFVWSAITILVLAGIAFFLLKPKPKKPPFNPTANACTMAAAVCPQTPYDVDTNGCPNALNHPEMGGYEPAKKVCTVKFPYYKQFGGCNSAHEPPMMFYSQPGAGQASRFHLVADPPGTAIRAYFTEIVCDTHKEKGAPGLAQPFVIGGDDFLTFKSEHNGDADPANRGKCYKVTVDDVCTIDPHISIGN